LGLTRAHGDVSSKLEIAAEIELEDRCPNQTSRLGAILRIPLEVQITGGRFSERRAIGGLVNRTLRIDSS